MLTFIDNFLNKTAMYRLVLYVLCAFFLSALALSFFGVLPFGPTDLLASALIIGGVSWLTNYIFAKVFEAPANTESVYITALILVFLITPPQAGDYTSYLPLAVWAAVWAMASKFMFAIGKKHLFNPAAFAVVLTALTFGGSATWWIGMPYMLPVVAIGGALIVRKIHRADMVLTFLATALAATVIGFWLSKGMDPVTALSQTVLNSALVFFACVMLTEPLTTPPSRGLRIAYGALVGFLFSPALHLGTFYSTPELALVIGNLFSYLVSPKEKLILTLKEMRHIAADTYEFIFANDRPFAFTPGQYMEWTLAHRDPDSRGIRRYFTIASSPTEKDIKMGIKFYPEPSSFKNRLFYMGPGTQIIASQTAGDFVMPKDAAQPLVFIAGGIGVTPFRSMIQYLLDTKEARNVVLFYCNKTAADIAYKDIFDRAAAELGTKVIYVITDPKETLTDPAMRRGPLDANAIAAQVPNFQNARYYISGPHGMVAAYQTTLKSMGVSSKNITTDYFPGFA